MTSRVDSVGLSGISGYPVMVECSISSGLPGFELVGLPDAAVRESRERVRAAIKNSGFRFPVSRITLNLAPAGTKKTGTLYDLPILLGILAAQELVRLPREPSAFLGELSLEGKLRPVNGVLPMAIAARKAGIRTLYVPAENAREATLAGGLTVIPVRRCGSWRPICAVNSPSSRSLSAARGDGGAPAGLQRRHGAGACQARARGRGRRRAQCAARRPAGLRQEHAGPAACRPSCRI